MKCPFDIRHADLRHPCKFLFQTGPSLAILCYNLPLSNPESGLDKIMQAFATSFARPGFKPSQSPVRYPIHNPDGPALIGVPRNVTRPSEEFGTLRLNPAGDADFLHLVLDCVRHPLYPFMPRFQLLMKYLWRNLVATVAAFAHPRLAASRTGLHAPPSAYTGTSSGACVSGFWPSETPPRVS